MKNSLEFLNVRYVDPYATQAQRPVADARATL